MRGRGEKVRPKKKEKKKRKKVGFPSQSRRNISEGRETLDGDRDNHPIRFVQKKKTCLRSSKRAWTKVMMTIPSDQRRKISKEKDREKKSSTQHAAKKKVIKNSGERGQTASLTVAISKSIYEKKQKRKPEGKNKKIWKRK